MARGAGPQPDPNPPAPKPLPPDVPVSANPANLNADFFAYLDAANVLQDGVANTNTQLITAAVAEAQYLADMFDHGGTVHFLVSPTGTLSWEYVGFFDPAPPAPRR